MLVSGCALQNTSSVAVIEAKPEVKVSEERRWTLMIGKWYGSQPTKEGGLKQHIVERYPNGSYKIIFKVTDSNGGTKESVEVGNWGISGPIYFTIFRGWLHGSELEQSNPSSPYNYDAYNIVSLADEHFEYSHVTTGNSYKIQRVSADFEFPK